MKDECVNNLRVFNYDTNLVTEKYLPIIIQQLVKPQRLTLRMLS